MPTNDEPYDTPSKATAVEGEVVMSGPNGVGVSLTPQAAETTARRLLIAAKAARAQIQMGFPFPGPT